MLLLLKNNLHYLEDILEWFFKDYSRLFFYKIFFPYYITIEVLILEEENIIWDIGNLFRLEKETKIIIIN